MMPEDRSADIAALAWLVSVGADEAIADTPVDRFRLSGRVATMPDRPAPPPSGFPQHEGEMGQESSTSRPEGHPMDGRGSGGGDPPARATSTIQGTHEASATARELAAAANTLDELKQAIANFDGISLKATATNLVFADGNPEADLMLIGEAPGAEEDRRGLPFVGAAGQLLDRMLAAIELDRTSSYITNIVNWRPPGNRKPSPAEMLLCQPFIERHIALMKPKVILLLGDTAAKTLTGRSEGITRLRGKWCEWNDDASRTIIPMLPTFHPAFLLRSPGQKREAWADLLAAKAKLKALTAAA